MHHQNPDTYNSSEDSRREGSKEHNSAQVENEHRNRHVMYVRERNGIRFHHDERVWASHTSNRRQVNQNVHFRRLCTFFVSHYLCLC